MRTINRQRANILLSTLTSYNNVLTPLEVSNREVVFESRAGSVLRWSPNVVHGYCDFGASLKEVLRVLPGVRQDCTSGSLQLGNVDLSTLMQLFRYQHYILWYEIETATWRTNSGPHVIIVLKEGSTARGQVKAWYHALLLSRQLHKLRSTTRKQLGCSKDSPIVSFKHVASTLQIVDKTFEAHARRLKAAGWDLEIPALETCSGCRILAI